MPLICKKNAKTKLYACVHDTLIERTGLIYGLECLLDASSFIVFYTSSRFTTSFLVYLHHVVL